jgi:hypothetical protein
MKGPPHDGMYRPTGACPLTSPMASWALKFKHLLQLPSTGQIRQSCFGCSSGHSKQLMYFKSLQHITSLGSTHFLENAVTPAQLGMETATMAMVTTKFEASASCSMHVGGG